MNTNDRGDALAEGRRAGAPEGRVRSLVGRVVIRKAFRGTRLPPLELPLPLPPLLLPPVAGGLLLPLARFLLPAVATAFRVSAVTYAGPQKAPGMRKREWQMLCRNSVKKQNYSRS